MNATPQASAHTNTSFPKIVHQTKSNKEPPPIHKTQTLPLIKGGSPIVETRSRESLQWVDTESTGTLTCIRPSPDASRDSLTSEKSSEIYEDDWESYSAPTSKTPLNPNRSLILSAPSIDSYTRLPGYGVPCDTPQINIWPSTPLTMPMLGPTIIVGEKIGSGSFGEVRAITFHQTPAIPFETVGKFFRDHKAPNTEPIQHEMNILKTLQGREGIIQLVDIPLMVDGTLVGYAMERGEGTLKSAMKHHPLSLEETVHLAKDLISGGCSLEAKGLVHRDGKPDNVVKVPRQDGGFTWKKIDFGLATTEGSGFQDCGTLRYRSPESYGGINTSTYLTSGKQDVFSDGLIIAENLLQLLPDAAQHPKTIIHSQNDIAKMEGSYKDLECNDVSLIFRVFTNYTNSFYTPAVQRLEEVKQRFPESHALIDLAIRMIDPNPANRPYFSECRQILR
jgi:hypothetical protein